MSQNKTQNYDSSWFSSTFIPGSPLLEQQSTLLAVLQTGLRESIPLASMLRALASEYPGSYSQKIRRLARLIDQGESWVDALEQTPGALPADTVLALRIGQQSGITNATFEQIRLENSEDLMLLEKPQWKRYVAYWLATSLVMICLLSFFAYFIAPTLKKMMEEFGIEQGIWNISMAMRYAVLPVIVTLGLIIAGIVLNWSSITRSSLSNLLRLPTESWGSKNATLLGILANTTKHGRPMAGALSTLAKFHTDSEIRRRLLIARNEIEQGAEQWESLRAVGLLSPPQKEILLDQSNENQSWILRNLSKSLRYRQQYRWKWLESLVHPLIVIVFGFAVLGICSATLDSLYSIVSELAKDTSWR